MVIVSGIYVIRNKRNNKVYIGSSQHVYDRMHHHKRALIRGNHDNGHLQNAWHKYGESAFEFKILERCEIEMLAQREQFWIDTIDSKLMYNIAKLVIGSMRGVKHTPEAIEKMKKAQKGRKASPEARAKMSISRMNPPAELRYKFGNGARGKKRTPESVAKMIDKIAKEYIVINPDGVEMHIKNLNKFCRDNDLSVTHMAKVSRQERTHHKGWKCRKVE